MELIHWSDFERVDFRIGTIVEVTDFPEAKKPAFKLRIDLGAELGIKQSSAQITKRYSKEHLLGKQILCVVNFPPKQVGSFMSEVLTTGLIVGDGDVVLLSPDTKVENGSKLA